MADTESKLARAIAQHSLTTRIVRVQERDDGSLKIWLADGNIVVWTDEDAPPTYPRTGSNLTDIPGVGPATAQTLRQAGLYSFQDLADAVDTFGLPPVISKRTAKAIARYLRQHAYLT